MQAILRESVFGQAVNALSKGKLLPYPEEQPGFQVPAHFYLEHQEHHHHRDRQPKKSDTPVSSAEKPANTAAKELTPNSTFSGATVRSPSPGNVQPQRDQDRDDATVYNFNEEHAEQFVDRDTHPEAVKVEEGKDKFLVGWYSDNDPENPQNWSSGRKGLTLFCMQLLTFSMYIGSAIYTPSIPGIMEEFSVSQTKATLGLSLYVLAYGLGPMLLSPLSEIPSIGRLSVYMVSLFLFTILQIPTALAPNYSTLMAMRALAGFVCSPPLSTGGATLADVFKPMVVPYVVSLWSAGAVAGPVAGPVAGGFAAMKENWRWPLYMLLFISVFCLFFLTFFFPETSADTILLRRAQRLRKITGNPHLRSQSEINSAGTSFATTMKQSLSRPFLLLRDPAVLFTDTYIALTYAIFYLWFEAFPLVFTDIYHFNLGESGLPFLGFIIALVPTLIGYCAYQKYSVIPAFKRTGTMIPEDRLKIALFGSFIIPMALFIFGWTSRASVHWIAPIIGAALYLPGIFLIFQGAIVYLPMSYGQYAASVLAGNALLRGAAGAAFPLFGKAFFERLGIGAGSSLLAGLAIIMIPPLFLLYRYGAKLRAMSKYATS